MKLVIDIPDELYEILPEAWNGSLASMHLLATVRGGGKHCIPLPKGHGRIIDESKITACEWDGQQMTTNAPTIIEADREDKE